MPVVLLERMPLPSLRTYVSVSVLLVACAVYYSHQVLTGELELEISDKNESESVLMHILNNSKNVSLKEDGYIMGTGHVMCHTTWCVWVLVNLAYCGLILFGKMIQHLAFGELRVSEQQHIKDKFWNFVFYKFIFIFGVMNVQDMGEVILWCAWFSVLGFLHLLAQLCKDRFEYLSFSPTISRYTHVKVVSLLMLILSVSGLLLGGCIVVCYFYASLNTFAFMAAECILLINRTLYVIVRYSIHLWDLNHDGVWENRALYVYYSELVFELAGLSVDFIHHLHMLVWGNIFLSMASLVICMQLRYLFHEFQRRIRRHKNYLQVVTSMEAKFPMATREELANNNDDCAICWEKMEAGRKLPCGHFYHNACLRSWLEQDTSCPTCRTNLGDPPVPQQPPSEPHPVDPAAPLPAPPQQPNRTFNHFFHFDGSRYVSWLPSFSVEVTHTELLATGPRGLLQRQQQQQTNSQLDNMARQVQEVFPNMPANVLINDLRATGSVEITIENIIEGRLQQPPTNFVRPPSPSGSTNSSGSSSLNDYHEQLQYFPGGGQDAPLPPGGLDLSHLPGPGGEGGGMTFDAGTGINYFLENLQMPQAAEDAGDPSPQAIAEAERHSRALAQQESMLMDGEEVPSACGSRFSKSSTEREKMLGSRKESLMEAARRRYLNSNPNFEDSSENEEVQPSSSQRRRELAYRAAQRRMQRDN